MKFPELGWRPFADQIDVKESTLIKLSRSIADRLVPNFALPWTVGATSRKGGNVGDAFYKYVDATQYGTEHEGFDFTEEEGYYEDGMSPRNGDLYRTIIARGLPPDCAFKLIVSCGCTKPPYAVAQITGPDVWYAAAEQILRNHFGTPT